MQTSGLGIYTALRQSEPANIGPRFVTLGGSSVPEVEVRGYYCFPIRNLRHDRKLHSP